MFKFLKEVSYEFQLKYICFGLFATCKHLLQSLRCSCKQFRPKFFKKKVWLEYYLEHGVFSIKQISTTSIIMNLLIASMEVYYSGRAGPLIWYQNIWTRFWVCVTCLLLLVIVHHIVFQLWKPENLFWLTRHNSKTLVSFIRSSGTNRDQRLVILLGIILGHKN